MRPQSLAGHRRVRTCSRLRHPRPRCPHRRRRRRRSALSRLVDDVFSHKLGLSAAVASACLSHSLTHSHTVSLSANTYQVIYSHSHTHTHSRLLSHALFVHSSSFRSFVRSFAEPNVDDEEVLSHCCRPLPIHSPRPRLASCVAACCVSVLVLVFVLLCFTSYVLVCVLSPSPSVCVGVSSRRFVLCWLDNDNDNDNRATAAAAAEPAKTRSPLDASQ